MIEFTISPAGAAVEAKVAAQDLGTDSRAIIVTLMARGEDEASVNAAVREALMLAGKVADCAAAYD